MKKLAILTAATALFAMTGSLAYAQNATPDKSARQERMDKKADWETRRVNMQRLQEARLAGVPAGLKLTVDQQKLWQPVETAIKSMMKSRSDLMVKMREFRDSSNEAPDFMKRLETRSEMSQLAAQNSKMLLDAMKPFWASLDDEQKKLLPRLIQPQSMGGMDQMGRMGGMDHMGGMNGHGAMMDHGNMENRGPGKRGNMSH